MRAYRAEAKIGEDGRIHLRAQEEGEPAHSAVALATEVGLTGEVSVSFLGLVTLLAASESNRTVRLSGKQGEGTLWFRDGDVVHAVTGALSGQNAVAEMLKWKAGHFRIEPWREPLWMTIKKSSQQLLLEIINDLDTHADEEGLREQLPPVTRRLLGVAQGANEDDYRRFLEEKHR